MQANPIAGVLLHSVGALSSSSCYTPQKKTTLWSWEIYWITQASFAWFILPILFAFVTIPNYMDVLAAAPKPAMLRSFLEEGPLETVARSTEAFASEAKLAGKALSKMASVSADEASSITVFGRRPRENVFTLFCKIVNIASLNNVDLIDLVVYSPNARLRHGDLTSL